jgi:hypothetical protein
LPGGFLQPLPSLKHLFQMSSGLVSAGVHNLLRSEAWVWLSPSGVGLRRVRRATNPEPGRIAHTPSRFGSNTFPIIAVRSPCTPSRAAPREYVDARNPYPTGSCLAQTPARSTRGVGASACSGPRLVCCWECRVPLSGGCGVGRSYAGKSAPFCLRTPITPPVLRQRCGLPLLGPRGRAGPLLDFTRCNAQYARREIAHAAHKRSIQHSIMPIIPVSLGSV